MRQNENIRQRNLPHIDPVGKPFFVTACLYQSINAKGLKRVRDYREELSKQPCPEQYTESAWKRIQDKLVFKLVDSILDGEPAAQYLKNDQAAEIVQNAFLFFADERYRLLAFVVMPSHHHWVFWPNKNWTDTLETKFGRQGKARSPREVISHSIQSYTGSKCNEVLGLSGPFWQRETYDHFVRDEDELIRIIHYIEKNPVVAGLASKPDEYRWSSAFLRKKLGIRPGGNIPNLKVI